MEGIDVKHKLGRHESTSPQLSAVAILFGLRSVRHFIWKKAKNSTFLKEKNICFGEDFMKTDKDTMADSCPVENT